MNIIPAMLAAIFTEDLKPSAELSSKITIAFKSQYHDIRTKEIHTWLFSNYVKIDY